MAQTALVTLHISFMSSPLGFALVVGMVVASLVLYYTMRVQSMSELLHPARESHNALQEDLIKFKKYINRVPHIPSISMFRPVPSVINPSEVIYSLYQAVAK
jgi:hypothetical protein